MPFKASKASAYNRTTSQCLFSTSFIPRPCIASRHSTATTPRRPMSTSHAAQEPSQTTIWTSLIPKAFRQPRSAAPGSQLQRQHGQPTSRLRRLFRPRNPATVFVMLGLLVGSQAIHTLSVRNESAAFEQRAKARLDALREVIDRVRAGEEVDVPGMLGTGDEEGEREWEELMRQLQAEDWIVRVRKKPRKEKNPVQGRYVWEEKMEQGGMEPEDEQGNGDGSTRRYSKVQRYY